MFLSLLIALLWGPSGTLLTPARGFLDLALGYSSVSSSLDSTGKRAEGAARLWQGLAVDRLTITLQGGMMIWGPATAREEPDVLEDTTYLRALPPAWRERFQKPSGRPAFPGTLWMFAGLHVQRLDLADPDVQVRGAFRPQGVELGMALRFPWATLAAGGNLDVGPRINNPELDVPPNSDNQHALWALLAGHLPAGEHFRAGGEIRYTYTFPADVTSSEWQAPGVTSIRDYGDRMDLLVWGEVHTGGLRVGLIASYVHWSPIRWTLRSRNGSSTVDLTPSSQALSLIPHIAYAWELPEVRLEITLEGASWQEYGPLGYPLFGRYVSLTKGATVRVRVMFP